MSDASTTRMLEAYIEQRTSPPMFLTSFFRITPRSFHDAEFVEVDIKRGEPHLAIPVQSVTSGARKVEDTKYENRKFKPPVYKLESGISAWSTSQRQPGATPFENPDFRRNAMSQAFDTLNTLEDMIRRSLELQASQIFTEGKINLVNESNGSIYEQDFQPRPSHFLVTVPWAADGTTGDPFGDIDALAMEVSTHGKMEPTDLIFGTIAWDRFLKSAKVKAVLDILGLQKFSTLRPENRPGNVAFRGNMTIGYTDFRLWLYRDSYIHPVTGEVTRYVAPADVLMIAGDGRRDLTFGSIPQFVPPEARAAQFLPSRMSSSEAQFDMTTNIWVTPDGSILNLSAGSRPLALPTALDTFGRLTVA